MIMNLSLPPTLCLAKRCYPLPLNLCLPYQAYESDERLGHRSSGHGRTVREEEQEDDGDDNALLHVRDLDGSSDVDNKSSF